MLPLQELPSLDLLQSFEAVARHLSFTNAARELHITQSAVSHQIRALESYLGVSLFLRQNRRVLLSPEGQVLFPAVISAFQGSWRGAGAGAGKLRAAGAHCGGGTTVRSKLDGPSQRQLPAAASGGHAPPPHLASGAEFHAGAGGPWLYWGHGLWQNLHQEQLMTLEYTPVCSPGLLNSGHPIRTPEDLQHYPPAARL